ncbi:hypothetical protein ACIRSU_02515 [Streptomyces sp. NPDC101160]|uniref:hypothetical protein n=1 Tax=Streptomyces sp. NPDC101160 TaxID=3366118 RepID=UPI00382AAEE5
MLTYARVPSGLTAAPNAPRTRMVAATVLVAVSTTERAYGLLPVRTWEPSGVTAAYGDAPPLGRVETVAPVAGSTPWTLAWPEGM